ncbi:Gcd10p family-domain-containing protein [Mucor mucedo]|uniref:Gcd10p family-domain-containing protein n=1 Tax=Mucor mucedo TaxID=29922 RepID=UPI00221EADC7|nr:Gcd10p family-domain-containing protein [Mucor mucedo]KAI7891178.1 Gcd10p family-domain-containing protein [Mucor mucedo]
MEATKHAEVDTVQAGKHILIQMPSGGAKIINLKANSNVGLGKFGTFNSDKLIGKPFGLSYEILGKDDDLRPVGHVSKNTIVEETTANNREIIDDAAVQKLSYEEVIRLKEQGEQGKLGTEEIIKLMVDSHSEFSKKTEYSKAKYIERKKKKFMKVFTPVRPTISTMVDYFFSKNPDKIKHLRIDTLSQLLCLANVHANNKMLVVDDTQGLIVASMLERMGGHGQVVAIHEGDNHNYDVLRYMNFSKEIQNTLYTVPFALVDPETHDEPFEVLTDEQFATLEDDPRRTYLRRKAAYDYKVKSRRLLHEGDFDGLIISSSLTPESVIKVLMKYMCGSRPVVVYSFNKEVLLQAAYWMRRSTDFLNAELTESSLREYQVLPGRMHPNMMMSCGGGYLLTALRIIDCPFDPSLAKRDGNDRRFKKKKTETPSADSPAVDSPVVDSPVVDSPAIDSPAIDSPAVDSPAMEE